MSSECRGENLRQGADILEGSSDQLRVIKKALGPTPAQAVNGRQLCSREQAGRQVSFSLRRQKTCRGTSGEPPVGKYEYRPFPLGRQ